MTITTWATWAFVENGTVRSLARGDTPPGDDWLPVEVVIPDHDPTTHRPTGASFTIENDKVIAYHPIVEIVEAPSPDDDEHGDPGDPQPDPTPAWLRERDADKERIAALTDAVESLTLALLMGGL